MYFRYEFKLRYQGARKAVGFYAEMVGLQKLQIQSASLVAIGANPVDFLPTASPSSHHPHRPPGSGQFMGSFSPNVFLFTGHFFPENVFRPATDPPLNDAPCLVPGFIQQNYPNDYSPVQNCFQCFLVPRDRYRGWRGGDGEEVTRLVRSPRGFVAVM